MRSETCADVARAIDLGAAIRLGASEANAGGRSAHRDPRRCLRGADRRGVPRRRLSRRAAALVERLWGERMRTPVRPLRDPKTVLQEWAQARGLPTPTYREVERTGPHHDPEFRVAVDAAGPRSRPKGWAAPSARPSRRPRPRMLEREGVRRGG